MKRAMLALVALIGARILPAQCDTIPAVQGDGPRSPCVDRVVTLGGVVTASFAGMQGFFLQDPAGDADPATSDGIFIFAGTGQNLPPRGVLATVTGRVVEFARAGSPGSVTEIDVRSGVVETAGQAEFARYAVLNPEGDFENALERFEGMLVAYPKSIALGPANGFGEYYALRMDRVPLTVRLFPSSFAGGLPVLIDQAGGAFRKQVKTFDLVGDLLGVLHFDFGHYRIEPVFDYVVSDGGLVPAATPATDGYLRVAFMNCERLVRQLTPAQLEQKLARLAEAIRTWLGSPDIVGVAEVEDLDLLERLGARAGNYKGVLLKGCDFSGINVGVLYDASRIRKFSETQLQGEAPQFRNGRCTLADGRAFSQFLFDRPPLAVDFAAGNVVFSVIVNHWRSRIGGNQAERIAGAEFLADEIARLGRENLIVLGDFNDSEDSPSLLTLTERTGLADLAWLVPADGRYSYIFEGVSEALDHILLSPSLIPSLGAYGYAHFNADFPVRAADHDAPYVILR
ncbi:MAG: endonuclease/exonuclease/phosphatase family protein [Acidobacteria bacterium]|nr:endonuclease/exonuclease/phosphatase family protein [Acidobacteriota bacterium]